MSSPNLHLTGENMQQSRDADSIPGQEPAVTFSQSARPTARGRCEGVGGDPLQNQFLVDRDRAQHRQSNPNSSPTIGTDAFGRPDASAEFYGHFCQALMVSQGDQDHVR